MRNLLNGILRFTVPGGLVLLAAVGFLRPHGLPAWLQQPVSVIPLVVLAFGLVFGWYLSSTRLILSFLILVCAERAMTIFAPTGSDPESPVAKLFGMSAFLVPLNLLAFSIFKEDAISTIRGAMRLALVYAQPFSSYGCAIPSSRSWLLRLRGVISACRPSGRRSRKRPWPPSCWPA